MTQKHLRILRFDADGTVIGGQAISSAVLPAYLVTAVGKPARELLGPAPDTRRRSAIAVLSNEAAKRAPKFVGVAMVACPSAQMIRSYRRRADSVILPEAAYHVSFAALSLPQRGIVFGDFLAGSLREVLTMMRSRLAYVRQKKTA